MPGLGIAGTGKLELGWLIMSEAYYMIGLGNILDFLWSILVWKREHERSEAGGGGASPNQSVSVPTGVVVSPPGLVPAEMVGHTPLSSVVWPLSPCSLSHSPR